jgi:hypothetical protein
MNRAYFPYLCFLLFFLQKPALGQKLTPDPLQVKVSFSYSQTSLYNVLNGIEEAYKIHFFYSEDLIPLDQQVSVHVQDQPLSKALQILFRGTTISYKMVGKQIVLVQVKESFSQTAVDTVPSKGPALKEELATKKSDGKNVGNELQMDASTIKTLKKWKRRHGGYGLKHPKRVPKQDSVHVVPDTVGEKKNNSAQTKGLVLTNPIRGRGKLGEFAIDFHFTVGPSFRKLSSDTKEGKDLIKQRNGEKPKPAFYAELLCAYYFSSSIQFSGGVGYMSMGEKGQYADGQSYAVTLHYMTFPFYATYQYHPNDFFLKTGIGFLPSLTLSQQDGLQYDKLGKKPPPPPPPTAAPAPSPSVSYRPVNLACSLRLEGGYKMNKIALTAGFQYIQYILSAYPSSSTLQEINYLIGFSVGMSYPF